MIRQNPIGSNLLSIGGVVAMVFSAAMGLLVLFVIPIACSFVSSLGVLILGFMFIGGGVAFLLGKALLWRRKGRY